VLAKNIVTENIPPLKSSDTGEKAIDWMIEFKLSHLPLVDNKKYIGLVSEDDILDFNDTTEKLGVYLKNLYKPYVKDNEHIFEVLRVASGLNTPVIPVVDDNMEYLGMITLQSLLTHFSAMTSISGTGGVIVLDLAGKKDYVLSDIVRIVESNDAHVLSMFINEQSAESHTLTIKVDKTDIRHIIATFERFEYDVQAYFEESDLGEIYKDRFDSLMNYLNI
jgi:predicted transcriptional regulator